MQFVRLTIIRNVSEIFAPQQIFLFFVRKSEDFCIKNALIIRGGIIDGN